MYMLICASHHTKSEIFSNPIILRSFQTNVAGSRRSHRKIAYFRMCGPLLFGIMGILIVGILYWLYFDLRQQLTDYRQKIEEGMVYTVCYAQCVLNYVIFQCLP